MDTGGSSSSNESADARVIAAMLAPGAGVAPDSSATAAAPPPASMMSSTTQASNSAATADHSFASYQSRMYASAQSESSMSLEDYTTNFYSVNTPSLTRAEYQQSLLPWHVDPRYYLVHQPTAYVFMPNEPANICMPPARPVSFGTQRPPSQDLPNPYFQRQQLHTEQQQVRETTEQCEYRVIFAKNNMH